MDEQLIYVGVISDAYHLKGLVKITSFTQKPEDICKLECMDKNGEVIKLSFVKVDKKRVICRIAGVDDRTAAEKILGLKLYALRKQLPETEEDEYYIDELVGLDVIDGSGKKMGAVCGAFNFGAGDILEIRFLDGKSEMYSFTRENFPEVTNEYVKLILNPNHL